MGIQPPQGDLQPSLSIPMGIQPPQGDLQPSLSIPMGIQSPQADLQPSLYTPMGIQPPQWRNFVLIWSSIWRRLSGAGACVSSCVIS